MMSATVPPVKTSPFARFLLVAAACVVVVAGMKAAEALLVPFLLSLFIAVLCSPSLSWMHRRGLPNWLAMVVMIVAILGAGTGVGLVVGSSLNDFRGDLPEYQARLSAQTQQLLQWLHSQGIEVNPHQWSEILNPAAAMGMVGNTLASFGNVMTNALLILLTVIFILAEEVRFSDKLRMGKADAEETISAFDKFASSVNQYMAIKLWLSLLTGVSVFVLLLCFDISYPVLWALMAFLLNFVPTLGSFLAAIPPILLALIQPDDGGSAGWVDAIWIGAGYTVINLVCDNVLGPRMMARGLDLSTLVVFLSLVFWGWVLGPVGMLLSVPLTMTVKIALEINDDTRWIGTMLGAGAPAPAAVAPADPEPPAPPAA
jgi:predicted PurR-regulated permease PerM